MFGIQAIQKVLIFAEEVALFDQFAKKHSRKIHQRFLFSQKDVDRMGTLQLKPLYMLPFVLEEL